MDTSLLVAFVLGVLATARLVRLVVHDQWPPILEARLFLMNWFIQREDRARERGDADRRRWDPRYLLRFGWMPVITCPFCFAPYAAAVVLAITIAVGIWSPDLGTLTGWWWVLAVWAAGSYLASIVVVYDEPAPVEDHD